MDHILIDESIKRYSFNKYIKYYEDKEKKLTINEILNKNIEWKQDKKEKFNFGYTSSVYWFKFTVENPLDGAFNWYLELTYPMLDSVELFIPGEPGKYEVKRSGDSFPFSIREIEDRNITFNLFEKPGIHTYYMRIGTTSALSFECILWSPIASRNSTINEYVLLWIYYGIMIIMVLYNLFIFISVKEGSYIYYVLFIASVTLMQSILNGFGSQYLWPNTMWVNNFLPSIISFESAACLLFFRSFLQTDKKHKFYNKVILFFVIPNILLLPSFLLNNYPLSLTISIGTSSSSIITMTIIASILSYKGLREARFFLFGFILFFLGALTFEGRSFGWLPHNFFTNSGIQVGAVLMVLTFSLGLADRIKKLKDELQELNIDLEKNVEIRTKELSEANKKLKKMDKVKSNFFANISHEIRTPLTLILSPIESVIQGSQKINTDNNFFKNIKKNALRLLKLINNILDISKLEAGKMKMKVQKIDIVKFFENYMSLIRDVSTAKGISLDFKASAQSIMLYIDVEKMDRITMNMLSNALKFTEEKGSILVEISEDNKNCFIKYIDTGIGLPHNMLYVIFDRFAQADSGSKRKNEGTGIGLSLAKELIELHGGSIKVESRFIEEHPENHGTTFTITIPKGEEHFINRTDVDILIDKEFNEYSHEEHFAGMREMDDLRLEENSDYNQVESSIENKSGASKILIVEDNPDMRNFIGSLLKSLYQIHFAANGEEGLSYAYEIRPDLIISDVMMPKMNGYDMTNTIKKDKELKIIPIIMLTAKSELENKLEGLEHGADDYLTKPFQPKELLARIKVLLKTREYEKIILKRNIEIEQELNTARLLQQRLLPLSTPQIPGYNSHITYIPMDLVGGDFFNINEQNNEIELYIADVSGHGLFASFLSTVGKITLENIFENRSCSEILQFVNNQICKSTVNNNFITLFLCKIDKKTNIARYSNAGHLPPIVYREKDNTFFKLNAKGRPLGWFEDLTFEEKEFQFLAGDRILFYTDGVTECQTPLGNEFGKEGLQKFLSQKKNLPPDSFSNNLIQYLKEFSESEKFSDDVCFIIVDIE
ncbi:MAG: SpoIIE family protein phosphatase [bacterium]|nr:SpoIIE family protein phosphatase [bacterium]